MAYMYEKPDVAEALAQFEKGSAKKYDALVRVLSDEPAKESEIGEVMHQLKHHASELTKEHSALISAVLHIKWIRMDQRIVTDYQAFVVNLIAANMVHLRPCIRMIVRQFLADQASEERIVMAEHSMHPHNLLGTILKLVPLTPTVLIPLLRELLPVVYRPASEHESYIQHLFQMMTYLPNNRKEILTMIIDHLTKLDVHSPKHEIEESEDSDEEDEMFEMEADMEQSDSQNKMTHVHANKLDILMDLLFRYIQTSCFPKGDLDWEATKATYRELLQVFDRVIFPTHDSCHVQFCMFYICSFHENLHEGFIDYLWKKVINPNHQQVFRQVAVSYIASLVARAKYIKLSMVTAVIDVMSKWVHSYIRQSADSTSQVDVTHHGPFFTVCQALFYILIYRNRELIAEPKGMKCVQSANFQTIVTCRLNPLRFCLPVITKTFASVARQHQLAFCDTIVERNRRNVIPVEGSSRDAAGSLNPLDSYFPFDPYILKRSSHYIEPLYQEYYGTPVVDDEEDEDSENIEDMYYRQDSEDNKKEDELMSTSIPKTKLSSSLDLLEYGISPGFKHA